MTQTDRFLPSRSISMLVKIKQTLLMDNNLCVKVTNLGKLAMACYMDDLIDKACRLETLYHDYYTNFHLLKDELDGYRELLGGYYYNGLSNERCDELKTLVHKWQAQDEGEEHAE